MTSRKEKSRSEIPLYRQRKGAQSGDTDEIPLGGGVKGQVTEISSLPRSWQVRTHSEDGVDEERDWNAVYVRRDLAMRTDVC